MITRREPLALAPGQARSRKPPSRRLGSVAEAVAATPFSQNDAAASALLGGTRVLRCESLDQVDVHNAIVQGLPTATLVHLKKSLIHLDMVDLGRALGVSERTLNRHVKENTKRIGVALGSRVWRFAELLARATTVFGGQDQAERWFLSHAMGLDGHRPIDLLQTSLGAQLLDDFLGRLENGVYA
ncbi:antitoxin Xre/MbcA/ParS toxin-binding domain-containing protein [Piscinibacter sp.]|uniref:type II RES/Xre toxin-antitoxin system antitoxin n=1 Tax=Piscinibacter sp. TaxID=1903157 RepID=UPI0025E0E2C5|nr:antitoxin Xre/MbcA/ParS toxin-binding domain-containing protein [Piscinibacter sp.]